MATSSTLESQLTLITRGLTGLDGVPAIRGMLSEKKTPKCIWITAPTGMPHIAYLVPLLKLADFAKAGLDVTVLLFDLYAFLVNYKDPMELVAHRTEVYKLTMQGVLRMLGVPDNKIHFVESSSYEFSKKFALENYKLMALTSQQQARDAGDEYSRTTMLSPLLCPGLTALAEEYLDSDIQFGGEDQKGLFDFCDHFLPQMGYRKRAHLMNPMVPGLTGTKMSASIPDSKIEMLDDPETIYRKILNAPCVDGKVVDNGLLAVLRLIVIPVHRNQLENTGGPITGYTNHGVFEVTLESGGRKTYQSYEDVELDFSQRKLSSSTLKKALAVAICEILAPLRNLYAESAEWQSVQKLAYP